MHVRPAWCTRSAGGGLRRGIRWHPGERGEVERGQGWCHARRACHWLSEPPFPRPAPQVTSEALPYCILRRMSTDNQGAAPLWAGAVIVGGLVGSELGARQFAEVTLWRLLAVVLALASRKSARTRRAYRNDVTHFMRTLDIRSEDVQSAAGHADPSTTKLYDRRGYNPEKSASFWLLATFRK